MRFRNDTGRVLRDEEIDGIPVKYWAPGDTKSVVTESGIKDAIRIGLTQDDVHSASGSGSAPDSVGSKTNTRRRRGRRSGRGKSKSGNR